MSRLGTLGARLYRGEVSYDFIGQRKTWYAVSAVLLAVSIVSLLTLQLDPRHRVPGRRRVPGEVAHGEPGRASGPPSTDVVEQRDRRAVGRAGHRARPDRDAQHRRGRGGPRRAGEGVRRQPGRGQHAGHRPELGRGDHGQGAAGLIFFLLGVVIFLSLYFEWKMALAAIIALLHDLVDHRRALRPDRLRGDTGDGDRLADDPGLLAVRHGRRVRQGAREHPGPRRRQPEDVQPGDANLAVNQTLVRSINTSIIALLPVGAILFVGVVLLGAGALKDLALVLFVGMAVGAYSSIFIATPLLASSRSASRRCRRSRERVAGRRAGTGVETPSARRRAAAAESAGHDGAGRR